MQTPPLPNKIYFTEEKENRSVIVIEPLYPGYGMTLGNALRRVLLSSLPGAAVTAVKIKGVDHEFSTIPSVSEDVVDIILNLKKLRLKLHAEEPVRLAMQVKGQKEARAGDFKTDARVEIVNKDLVIATLDSKTAELSLEIVVEAGRGYVPVELRESEKLELGMIAVDAIFTPIRNVNFNVENVRVGQITNYDKLTLTMETDGTITGRSALDIAARILVDHFSQLGTKQLQETEPKSQADQEEIISGGDLETLGLSNRAYNALLKNKINSLKALKKLTVQELEQLEGLGEKSVHEIVEALKKHEAS